MKPLTKSICLGFTVWLVTARHYNMAAKQRSLLLALVQLKVGANKAENLANARALVTKAAENGAKLVSLPECFNSPYGTQYFAEYAEKVPGETTDLLSKLAKDLQIHLVGGSIPESCDGKLYNTATVFGPDGGMLGTFRKMHLFDIDVPGKITVQESSVLSPGSSLLSFEVGKCKVGIGICYDIRFPELAHLYDQQGCSLLLYPGAFNMTTGPAHWQSLVTARALDNQLVVSAARYHIEVRRVGAVGLCPPVFSRINCVIRPNPSRKDLRRWEVLGKVYVAGCSPARDESATYVAWGHSVIVDPWGKVVAKTEEKEDIIYADIDLDHIDAIRSQIPTHFQKRTDVYKIEDVLSK